jgi:hypothetical protein
VRVLKKDKIKRVFYILVVAFISLYSVVLMFCFPYMLVMNDYLAHGSTVSGQVGEIRFFTPIPIDVEFQAETHLTNEPNDREVIIGGGECLLNVSVSNNGSDYFHYYDYCSLNKDHNGAYITRIVHSKLAVGWNVIKYSIRGRLANQKNVPVVMYVYLASKNSFFGVTLMLVMLIKFMFVMAFGVFYSIFNIRG